VVSNDNALIQGFVDGHTEAAAQLWVADEHEGEPAL